MRLSDSQRISDHLDTLWIFLSEQQPLINQSPAHCHYYQNCNTYGYRKSYPVYIAQDQSFLS